MPDELVEEETDARKGSLSVTQRERLEDLLRNITPERLKVAEGMVFCIEHADAAEEICECILESLSSLSTALYKKVNKNQSFKIFSSIQSMCFKITTYDVCCRSEDCT